MQALVDASPSFQNVIDRIKSEDPDAKLDSKSALLVLFWCSMALMDEEVVQKDLSGDKPYKKLYADLERMTKDKKKDGLIRDSRDNEEKIVIKVLPELEDKDRKLLLMALLNVTPAFRFVAHKIKKSAAGLAVQDIVESLQAKVRDAYIKNRKGVRTLVSESLAKKLKQALEDKAILSASSSSGGDVLLPDTSASSRGQGNGAADGVLEKIRGAQKQQLTGAVTRDFMVGLADTGSKDLQEMLGGIDARTKEFAAHTMSVTYLLTESFRTFSELLRKVNPGRVLKEYEQILKSIDPLAPDQRQRAAASLELERAYVDTRQDIEEEFARMQERIALALERVDRVRAETIGSQYTWAPGRDDNEEEWA